MGFVDLFGRVKTRSAEEARQWMAQQEPQSYTLLDVREPIEYEGGHLPGALLIPLSQLPGCWREMDPSLPTLIYCRSGRRSRSAAHFLANQGLDATSMDGGIDAWHGWVSEAPIDQGIYLMDGDETPAHVFSVAYQMEDATRRFYRRVAQEASTPEVRELAESLSRGEQSHGEKIRDLCRKIGGEEPSTTGHDSDAALDLLEDGTTPQERIERLLPATATPATVLDLAMALEIDSLDLYLRLTRRFRAPTIRNALFALAREEQTHLTRLGQEWGRLP